MILNKEDQSILKNTDDDDHSSIVKVQKTLDCDHPNEFIVSDFLQTNDNNLRSLKNNDGIE